MCRALQRHGWVVCYAFMLAFFLVMVPSLAYADTYVATEDSAVRAAMVYLGYDPDEGESTNKLVTAFYDATSGEEYTGWQSFVNGLYQPLATVNYNEQWWSPADGFMFTAQVDAARSDAAKIYAAWKSSSGGGGSGGGSGPTVTDDYVLLDMTKTGYQNSLLDSYSGVALHKNYYDNIMNTVEASTSGLQLWIAFGCQSNDESRIYVTVNVESIQPQIEGNYSYKWPAGGVTFNGVFPSGGFWQGWPNGTVEHDGKKYAVLPPNPSISQNGYSTAASGGNVYDACRPVYAYYYGSGGGGTVTPDPEPEPEPEPPTPPEPPRDPTPPTPDPTQPSQTIDLQGIIDRLDIIIRNQVVLINWLDDAFASVTANIQWLGELIDESFGWLWEVLENLQGSIDGGITRITTWLEMIYNRIGGQGGTVSRPQIDTPTPWDDFLSWLEGILHRLLDLIFGVTPAALQNLLSGLADLTTKFPFSIPWDLAGLITLFVHQPATPVFDLPLYMPYEGTIVNFHIDLSTWNDVMQIARDGEVILFAAWLIMATPDFYRHLNSVTGSD